MSRTPFKHKRSLGQHFLSGPAIPRLMCETAKVGPKDVILEIGPGTGALTRELLERGARVVAVETDPRAIDVLREVFATAIASGRLIIHESDARRLEPCALSLPDHGYKVVANIPYYLSGHLFRVILESPCQPSVLVFLVQDEVARRIARDRRSSLLSLGIGAFGTASYVRKVGKGHFTPPPRVDSAIIAVRDISRTRFGDMPPNLFFSLLRLGFGKKRKQLMGNLRAHYDQNALKEAFATLALSPTVRAENIDLETWFKLARALYGSP